MVINWISLAFLAGFSGLLYNSYCRKWLKDDGDASTFSWWFSVLRSVVFAVVLYLTFDFNLNIKEYLLLISLGLGNFINLYFFMKMHTVSHLSLSTIIKKLQLVWVPVAAYFILGEVLSFSEYLGIALLFASVVIIAEPKKIINDRSLLTPLVSSFITSALILLLKYISPFAPTPLVIFSMSLPAVFLFPLVMKEPQRRLFGKWKDILPKSILAVFLSVVSLYAFVGAFKLNGPAGIVNAINQSVMMMGVLVGVVYFKEKENMMKKLIGSALVIFGVLLLT